ncbi:MAG: alpha/beta fold hydrolase [Deltaproteobacteria bacterium]|nr:alpha/beta fold hydrolase [Deltaproteobacteria bacterium]
MTFDVSPYRSEYPWEGSFLGRPAGRLHYLDVGKGDPVLMVHGNPSWSFYWRHLVKALSPSSRCIVPDHLGMGLSDKPGDGDYRYTLDSRVDDLEALMDELGITSGLTLIAHDWGGMIGLALAERRRGLVKRIVLMNTSGFSLPKNSALPWQLFLVRRLPFALPVRGLNVFAAGAARTCVSKPMSPLVRAAYVAPYDSWAHRIAVHRFVQDIPLSPKDPAWSTVQKVSEALPELCKDHTMVVWGRKDFVFDDDFLEEWRRRLPDARYLVFDDAGHYVLEDEHEAIVPAVQSFMASS